LFVVLLVMAPPSQELEPPTNPARFKHTELDRSSAPCSEVAETTRPLVIPDLLDHPFYKTSQLALSGTRFYAGAPLTTRDGFGLGSLCVTGTEPRTVTADEMAALRDLAAMTMSQIELQHAFGRIDPISGLPNRRQFLDDLDDLTRDHGGERRLLVMLDLARTDQIDNMTRVLGSEHVVDMVKVAALQLRDALAENRRAYHVAATQFVFFAEPDVEDDAYVALLTEKVEQCSRTSTLRFSTTGAVGVVPIILGMVEPTDVLRFAHGAAQDARTLETTVSFFSSANDTVHRRRYDLLRDFEAALATDDQLRLVYQPRVNLTCRRCLGAEVLLRWNHPILGEVSPAEFIPLIEQTSHAKPLTQWVVDRALEQLGGWITDGFTGNLSINLSANNLEEPDFAARIQLLLLKHRIRADRIELEVTESAIMRNVAQAREQLAALRAAGVRLAIDDFGTGYSSLAYLQQLPVDVVKIDQSFMRDLDSTLNGGDEQTLVRTMIRLSHELGYRVVAEGVETEGVAACLSTMECDEAQGFLFARPMPAAQFLEWFMAHPGDAASTPRAAA
ncbi:sensor domain-containing phosphodiesterase, partial [Sphingomonas faeni]|uniref:sensor domain-containing phosphodiesterase n=2 Tax=Sphingomonas faeni TaxID=185950 RepID=UPI003356B158